MVGCPNRCKHCWLKITPNGKLAAKDLKYVANAFRPFAEILEVTGTYREEDYSDNYKEVWTLSTELSDIKQPHFENISYWRAVRDDEYISWLYSLGVRAAQLTIFGNEDTTDYFVGRKGAFKEILQTIALLIQNKIAPRIQTFIYKSNIAQLQYIQQLIEKLDLEDRCRSFDKSFAFFLHQGSCEGENAQFYDVWITPDDIEKIPRKLVNYTEKYFGVTDIREILGEAEQNLCHQLLADTSTRNIVEDSPVFYIDKNFDVYPNFTTPSTPWLLGNLKTNGAEYIVKNYINNATLAQQTLLTVPLNEMVRRHGNLNSQRLFCVDDYKNFLLTKELHHGIH